MLKIQKYKTSLTIILVGIIIYIPFLGGVNLFDWDEINFAESAREMILSGNFLDVQINYLPFWEKPPLFIWMQVFSMKLFGINEFAARFPNAICGIITLLVLFHTGKKFRDEKFGWIWVMTYAGSMLPFFYFKSGIIDPWFNLFIFLGIINFVFYLKSESLRTSKLVYSALFIGLAILTKGPVALLIFVLSFLVYLIIVRFRIITSARDVFIFLTILAFSGGFWFILQILSGNLGIIRDFIIYQVRLFKTEDAGHGGFVLYHFVILFLGVFPASIFALFSFFRSDKDKTGYTDFGLWMQILFFVVLILFTLVRTKIVHYSSMCYFPLTFVASLTIWKIISGEMHAGRMLRYLLVFLSTLVGTLITALPFIDKFKETIITKGWIKDEFAIGNLQASGNWTGFESLIGILYTIFSIWLILNFAKDPARSIKGIFASTLVMVFLAMAIITPRIEAYSQRAAVEFYRSIEGEDAYITTLGFKSYAHLFYGGIKPPENKSVYENGWFLKGNIDKVTYVVFKNNRKARYLNEYPFLIILYEKNGFVFAKRLPK
jgi:4-amino-4-deoxy-L-arabinose transferase-like glycosyltransferase